MPVEYLPRTSSSGHFISPSFLVTEGPSDEDDGAIVVRLSECRESERSAAIVICGKVDRLTVEPDTRTDGIKSVEFYDASSELPKEMQADISFRCHPKTREFVFSRPESTIGTLVFRGEGELSGSPPSVSASFRRLAPDASQVATLAISNCHFTTTDHSVDDPIKFGKIELNSCEVNRVHFDKGARVEVTDSVLHDSSVKGELLVPPSARVTLHKASIRKCVLNDSVCVVVSQETTIENLTLQKSARLLLTTKDSSESLEAELVVGVSSETHEASGSRLTLGFVKTHKDASDRFAMFSVEGSAFDLGVSAGLRSHKPSGLIVAKPGSQLTRCELEGVAISLQDSSIFQDARGDCWIATCCNAYLGAASDNRLEVIGITGDAYPHAENAPFKGAVIEGAVFNLASSGQPSLVALADCATLNPYVDDLPRIAVDGRRDEQVGVELLNRAIAKSASLGSVRTTAAYAAGLARSKTSPSRSERNWLRLFGCFGYGQQPLRAFIWWIGVAVTCTAAVFWHRCSMSCDCSSACPVVAIGELLLGVLAEPLGLLQVKSSESVLPWTGYPSTFWRLALTLSFGHFIVALSRYTRVTLK